MGALLHLLLIIFLAGIFFVGIVAYRIYRSIHDAAQQFRNFGSNGQDSRRKTYNDSRTGSSDETIIDRRDSSKTKRRIFQDNEGEYVDFEE